MDNKFCEPAHVLVVDDDDRIRELLQRYLQGHGYRVSIANGANTARKLFASLDFDLVILDIMMPGEDGLQLLSWLRQTRRIPVILLTARGLTEDRIEGFEKGADDYIPKPFEPKELRLRIAAILRRATPIPVLDEISLSDLLFNLTDLTLSRDGKAIHLTDSEAKLLFVLARRHGEPVTRHELAELTGAQVERSVDVQMTRLRRKIEPDPKIPKYLQTVRGIGYRLVVD